MKIHRKLGYIMLSRAEMKKWESSSPEGDAFGNLVKAKARDLANIIGREVHIETPEFTAEIVRPH